MRYYDDVVEASVAFEEASFACAAPASAMLVPFGSSAVSLEGTGEDEPPVSGASCQAGIEGLPLPPREGEDLPCSLVGVAVEPV